MVWITLKNPKQKKRGDSRDADDRSRDLPEWLEEFTEDLEDTEFHAPRTHFSGFRLGKSNESGILIKRTGSHIVEGTVRPVIF